MQTSQFTDLDETGKVVLDNIYNQSDPRAYFSTLQELDYCIPGLAKPVFRRIIDVYRKTRGKRAVRLVDVGCSYGVNSAMVRHDKDMDDLFRAYAGPTAGGFQRSELVARDHRLFDGDATDHDMTVIGMDAAPRAVGYGKDAGLLDRTIAADLETSRLGDDDRAGLAGTDLVISTGCVGYVSEKTLCQIADASEGRAWMAHFVLRMFPYDKVRAALAERGYVTARGSHTYRQRRFASAEEKAEVMNRLVALGIDPSGRESEGWLHADLYVSRPVEDSRKLSCRDLLPA